MVFWGGGEEYYKNKWDGIKGGGGKQREDEKMGWLAYIL